jgi:hypothetical protein
VEGYFDCLSLHRVGITNTVATLGTALTPDHARLLRRRLGGGDRVMLGYDADEAGRRAAMTGIRVLLEAGVVVAVLILPDGPEPDEVVRSEARSGRGCSSDRHQRSSSCSPACLTSRGVAPRRLSSRRSCSASNAASARTWSRSWRGGSTWAGDIEEPPTPRAGRGSLLSGVPPRQNRRRLASATSPGSCSRERRNGALESWSRCGRSSSTTTVCAVWSRRRLTSPPTRSRTRPSASC